MSIHNSTYFLNYVNLNFEKYINSEIIVFTSTGMLPSILNCKFIDYENKIQTNYNFKLLCRKPINIKIQTKNGSLIGLRKDQYYLVLSKEMLDLYSNIMKKNNIPKELELKIEEFIPEYCKLF